MNKLDEIMKRKKYLEKLITEKKKTINLAPQGSLRIIKHGKGWQYYYRRIPSDKNGIYIKKCDEIFIRSLAQKEYDQQIISLAEQELKYLKDQIDYSTTEKVEELYEKLKSPLREKIKPIKEPDNAYAERWMKIKYEKKGFRENDPEYYSESGERMRSKSETFIANVLKNKGLYYLYEKPIRINGLGIVYPDFTILDIKNRKEIIWEHLGLLDDQDYREKMISKIYRYEQEGFIFGDNLIISYETAKYPLNMRVIENKIERLKERLS